VRRFELLTSRLTRVVIGAAVFALAIHYGALHRQPR
jgi:hypothetical protein